MSDNAVEKNIEYTEIDLSIIVPLYNEEESIEPLYKAISSAVEPLNKRVEMVFVDDGSKDSTVAKGRVLAQQDPRLRLVKFRRNYGQTPAMAAGIDCARGRILVTMDGDLQNDPRDIPLFLEKIEEGYDIVVGWRHKRQDKLITRKIPSKIANWIIGKVTGVPIKDNGCSLKAYKAEVIKNVPLYSEMHRFIPAMTSIAGTRVAEIKVRHHARQFGESKYGLSRIYKVILDLFSIKTIISFAARPLHWFGLLAAPMFLLGIMAFLFAAFDLLFNVEAKPLVMFAVSILFVASSVFLILVGALCELVYRTGSIDLEKMYRFTSRVK